MSETSINFGLHPRDTPITTLNGPGYRFALWTQGCGLRCTTQCISPHLLTAKPRHLLSVDETLEILDERARFGQYSIEGITLLGGEPTDQSEPLAKLARSVHERGWSVMLYSGYTLSQLQGRKNQSVCDLLSETDILVDGPFQPEYADQHLRWRGSSNQQIWILSDRYCAEKLAKLPIEKGTDITITHDGRLIISGMQNREMVGDLVGVLRRKGLLG
jgi:anaerobic ribonucleoside-triphosphate reductase activating protein